MKSSSLSNNIVKLKAQKTRCPGFSLLLFLAVDTMFLSSLYLPFGDLRLADT
jgi:hypothetical protein